MQEATEAQASQERSFFSYEAGVVYTVLSMEKIENDNFNKMAVVDVYNPATDASFERKLKTNGFTPMVFHKGFSDWNSQRVPTYIKVGNGTPRALKLNDPYFLSPDGFSVEFVNAEPGKYETIKGKGLDAQPITNGVADPNYRQLPGGKWYEIVPVTQIGMLVVAADAKPYGANASTATAPEMPF
jgi:hypothetical protein